MPTVLEVVDAQHPGMFAPVHGPLALFTVGQPPVSVGKQDLLAVRQLSSGSTDWQVKTAAGSLALRPFTSIADEHYRLYLNVTA